MNSTMMHSGGGGGYQAPKASVIMSPGPSSSSNRGYGGNDDPFAGIGQVVSHNNPMNNQYQAPAPASQLNSFHHQQQSQIQPIGMQSSHFSSSSSSLTMTTNDNSNMFHGLQQQQQQPQFPMPASAAPVPSLYQQQQQQQQAPSFQDNSSFYQQSQQQQQQQQTTTTSSNSGMFLGLQSPSAPVPPTSGGYQSPFPTAASSGGYQAPSATTTPSSYNSNNFGMSTTSPSMQQHMQQYQATQSQSSSSSSSQAIDGMFLGLDAPKVTNNPGFDGEDGEDPELRRALEAALYAEGLLKEESKKQKAAKAKGPLGFGILPKAQNLFKSEEPYVSPQGNPNLTPNVNINREPKADIHVDDIYDEDGNRDDDRPSWLSSGKKSSAEADYGIGGGTVAKYNGDGEIQGRQEGSTPKKSAAVVGASVVGAVAGLVAVGPIVGIIGAAGAAYAAGTKEGIVGDAMRGTGSLAAKAGSAAKKFEDNHGVGKATVSGIAKGVGWIAKQTVASKNP